jgi:hypothetical protein
MAHPTVARRTERFFSEAIAPLFKSAGFKKTRLTFARDRHGTRQLVQAHVSVTVSGGSSPPEGFFRVWIGFDPLPSQATVEYQCAEHVELRDLVPGAAASWKVPPTKGPRRAALEREFSASIRALLQQLDARVRDRAAD